MATENAGKSELLISQRFEAGDSTAYVGINRGLLHWKIMSDGFMEVAERACAQPALPDAEIYAVLTCLRHGTELYVKYMVNFTSSLPDSSFKGKFKNGHYILENWNLITVDLKDIGHYYLGSGFAARVAELSRYITEIDQWDVNGQTFRYPETLKGERNLEGVESINIARLLVGIRKMRTLMTEIADPLGDYYQC